MCAFFSNFVFFPASHHKKLDILKLQLMNKNENENEERKMFGDRFSICWEGRSRLHTLDVISSDVPGRFQIMDGLKFYFKKLPRSVSVHTMQTCCSSLTFKRSRSSSDYCACLLSSLHSDCASAHTSGKYSNTAALL